MGNFNQAFSWTQYKDTFEQSLDEPQQKANAFVEHFHGVSSDADFRKHKVYNEPITFTQLKTAIHATSDSSLGAAEEHILFWNKFQTLHSWFISSFSGWKHSLVIPIEKTRLLLENIVL